MGYQVTDFSVNSDDPVNNPDVAVELCEEIYAGKFTRGILYAVSVYSYHSLNEIPGVRTAVIHDSISAERAWASNDAQVAALGSLVIDVSTAKNMLEVRLENEFTIDGRLQIKVDLINALDKKRQREIINPIYKQI